MTIFEIDTEIEKLVDEIHIDEETGEVISNLEAIEELNLAREQKIEGLLLAYKNKLATVKAIDEEIKTLTARKKAMETQAENVKSFATIVLHGEKFETSKVQVGWRKSEGTELIEGFDVDEYMTVKTTRTPNKTEIKKALKSGIEIPGAKLVESNNIQIK